MCFSCGYVFSVIGAFKSQKTFSFGKDCKIIMIKEIDKVERKKIRSVLYRLKYYSVIFL